MTDTKKVVGKIIKLSKDGWGFVSSKEIQFTRIFFHWTALQQSTLPFLELKTGMHVRFTPSQMEGKGWRAMHIEVIEKPKLVEKKEEQSGIPEANIVPLLQGE